MRAQMAREGAAALGGAVSVLAKRGFIAVACRVAARSIGSGVSEGAILQVRTGCEIAAHPDARRPRGGSSRAGAGLGVAAGRIGAEQISTGDSRDL